MTQVMSPCKRETPSLIKTNNKWLMIYIARLWQRRTSRWRRCLLKVSLILWIYKSLTTALMWSTTSRNRVRVLRVAAGQFLLKKKCLFIRLKSLIWTNLGPTQSTQNKILITLRWSKWNRVFCCDMSEKRP